MKPALLVLGLLLSIPSLAQQAPGGALDRETPLPPEEQARLDAFVAGRPRTAVAPRPADSPRRTPQPPTRLGSAVVFTVDSAYDDDPDSNGDGVCAGPTFGECQLRSAILEANAVAATQPVVLAFAVTTGPANAEVEPGTWRITLTRDTDGNGIANALPNVERTALTIDGLTQPGATCGDLRQGTKHDLRVILDGSNLSGPGSHPGIHSPVGGLTVRGLVVQNFPSRAILAGGTDTTVECNYLGTDHTGEIAAGNYRGAEITFGTVVNNLVSGNSSTGIEAKGSAAGSSTEPFTIEGNLIGTDADGDEPLGNGGNGISLCTFTCHVGIDKMVRNNVVSANAGNGVFAAYPTQDARLAGNLIGLSRLGESAGLGNGGHGVDLFRLGGAFSGPSYNQVGVPGEAPNWIGDNGGAGVRIMGQRTGDNVVRNNRIGYDTAGSAAPNALGGIVVARDADGVPDHTVIGGPTAADANFIAGNAQHGIFLEEDVASRVEGNTIGRTHLGTVLPNARDGLRLTGSVSPDVVRNTIVGNGAVGIALADDFGRTVTEAVVQGNFIGTDATGSALGNAADGIWCRNASGPLIGGGGGEGNTIAFNGTSSTFQDGIRVADEGSCTGYAIIANEIYANVGLGIDLSGGGVTPNDAPEADGFTNFPVGLTVLNDGVDAVVTVSLTGLPNATYRIDYFLNDAPDPTGYGEGATYRLSRNFTTGGGGTDTETFAREPVHFPVGAWVTATATLLDAGSPTGYGSTSEFSQAVQVTGPHYVVTSPAALGAYAHGSTLYVEWATPDPTLEAGPVRVSVLCPGQAPFVRYASTPNDGQAGFVVPASLGTHGGVDDQASGCTVEVASAADPSKAAESAPFTVRPAGIAGVTTRRLDLSTPRSPARYGLQDVVKWFWDPASVPAGHAVRVGLVCDGRARYVRYASTENDGQAGGTLPASFGAYDVCRAEIASVDDPTRFGRSEPFQVLGTPLPSVDVLLPAPGDVIAMGTDLDVTWETVAIGGAAPVRILLVDLTNGPPNRLVAQTTNTGSFTWSVPTDLDPAAEYRLSVKVTADDGSFPKALIHPLTFAAGGARAGFASADASAEDALPESLEVRPARPNPARSHATVRLGVPEAGPVEVAVYDAVGRRVAVLAAGERAAGWHDLGVEAGGLAPGLYVVRAVAGGSVATRTLTVAR